MLGAPLLREGSQIGVLIVARKVARRFTDKQIELIETFADQAVIAIENTRLFEAEQARTKEVSETLEQQTATSEVLGVISRSPTDVQPVFDTIAQSAARLCEAEYCFVYRFDGQLLHFVAHNSVTREGIEAARRAFPAPPSHGSLAGRAVLSRDIAQIPDIDADPGFALGAIARAAGYRSAIAVPMLRDGVPIGAIALGRSQLGLVPTRQVELLNTFADQAVIAIENTRLFEEVQARTAELTEALAHQTATGDILTSISGSLTDTKPVFDAIVRNLRRLVGSRFAVVQILQGQMVHMPAVDGEPGFEGLINRFPRPLDDTTVGGQAMLYKRTVQVSKLRDNPSAPPAAQSLGREFGYDSTIFSPMVLGGRVIGAIGAAHHEPREFTDKQVALMEAFADQAVIAIENTRLFEEVQARTRSLSEALDQQMATTHVLSVISSSPGELEPVFEAMLQNATRLCEGNFGTLHRYDGQKFYPAAMLNTPRALAELQRKRGPFLPERGNPLDRMLKTKTVVHVVDDVVRGHRRHGNVVDVEFDREILGVGGGMDRKNQTGKRR
jgi:GAF domain-containing protein